MTILPATTATRAATTRAASMLRAVPGGATDKVADAAGRMADKVPALADRVPALADRVVASKTARRLAGTATKATTGLMAGKAVAAGTKAATSGMAKAAAAGTAAKAAAAGTATKGVGGLVALGQGAVGQAGTERGDNVGAGTTRSTGTTRSAGDEPRRSLVRWPAVAALAGWAAAGTGVWADARRFGDLVWDDAGIDRSRLPLLVASGPMGAAWYWSTIRPALSAAAVGEANRGG